MSTRDVYILVNTLTVAAGGTLATIIGHDGCTAPISNVLIRFVFAHQSSSKEIHRYVAQPMCRVVLDIIAPRRYVAAPIQATGVTRVGYFGSKATSGLCQPLIAMMPPHDYVAS